ncbi:putative ankyrin repeat protein RF_0381 [Physella acuta]|uniref:putative ankyrin repeat protein RF_0381 n=1 Tax=Physella acuta TaxID=109671 RepID=UPI0027DC44D4|nr:putative ankyrin repeat protein RF_0381 [Physella acuta]
MLEDHKRNAQHARDMLQKSGVNFQTNAGSTLLHAAATLTPAHVYTFCRHGVPVNKQNLDGDTALHIAARVGNYNTAQALLQCSADLNIRNKIGQTPLDLAEGKVRKLLEKSEPGVYVALKKGNSKILSRILKYTWCSVNNVVQDDMSLLKLAQSKADEDVGVSACYDVLMNFKSTSEFVHAVLSEDVDYLRRVISSKRGCPVNIRYGGRKGRTLLCFAIESNNIEMVKLLVGAGARVNNVRVTEYGWSQQTIPLIQLALKPNTNPDILYYLSSVQNTVAELNEKDQNGNSALLRAIEEDASPEVINWLLEANGNLLLHRNIRSQHAREVAVIKKRDDVIQIIDKFLLQQIGKGLFFKLAVHFYGLENLQFKDKATGLTLIQTLEKKKSADDMKTLRHYSNIEKKGKELFEAVSIGDMGAVKKLPMADFQDKNGYTALIKAIVFNQPEVARFLITIRPQLKSIPDNSNRYPLHYAFALPESESIEFVKMLLENDPEEIEMKFDKDGIFPAEYINLRETDKVMELLNDARTLDVYGVKNKSLDYWNHENEIQKIDSASINRDLSTVSSLFAEHCNDAQFYQH